MTNAIVTGRTIHRPVESARPIPPCQVAGAHRRFEDPLLAASKVIDPATGVERPLTADEAVSQRMRRNALATECNSCPLFSSCLPDALCEVTTDGRYVNICAGLLPRQLAAMRKRLGLPTPPRWSFQTPDPKGLAELREHRATFSQAFDSLTTKQVDEAWRIAAGRVPRSSSAAARTTPTRGAATPATDPAVGPTGSARSRGARQTSPRATRRGRQNVPSRVAAA